MQPGWHTYWRYPGASGIAPSFDFSASQNLKTQDPVFPAPYFFDDGAGGFFGYEGLTGFVVPFLLENAGRRGQVSLNLELGVCREVCLPVQFSFDLPVMPGPLKTPDELDIIQAMLDADRWHRQRNLASTRSVMTARRCNLLWSAQIWKIRKSWRYPAPMMCLVRRISARATRLRF